MSLSNSKVVATERIDFDGETMAIIQVTETTLSDRSIGVDVHLTVGGGEEVVYYATDSVDAWDKVKALKAALEPFVSC